MIPTLQIIILTNVEAFLEPVLTIKIITTNTQSYINLTFAHILLVNPRKFMTLD